MKLERSGVIALGVLLIIIVAVSGTFLYFKYIYVPPPVEKIVEEGDCVDVNYVGKFASNGTIFDTSYESVAKENGIYDENRTYEPLRIFVDTTGDKEKPNGYENYSSSMITGFLKGLKGMKEGETKTVTIPPEEGYGVWNETLAELMGIGSIPRESVMNSTMKMNKTMFTSSFPNVTIALGTTFDVGKDQYFGFGVEGIFNATIINVTDTNVTVKVSPKNGSTFLLPVFEINATVIVYNDSAYTLRFDTEVNHTFSITGYFGHMHFKVVEVNETSIKLALNTQAPKVSLIDQPLVFELNVVKIYKTSQES